MGTYVRTSLFDILMMHLMAAASLLEFFKKFSVFVILLLVAISSSLPSMSATSTEGARPGVIGLSARLQSDGMKQCWDSLVELRSCTGEVILFFLNGETYLGPSCCRAIRVIEHHCWAADVLLATLGFTAQEGDILRGYCDATNDYSHPSPLPSSSIPPGPPPSPAASRSDSTAPPKQPVH